MNESDRVGSAGRSLHTFLFGLSLGGLNTDFFVILLKGSEILTGLGELSLFHTFSDVPVNEGSLGVHEIELVVESGPCLGDGRGVAQHAHSTLDLGQITAGNNGWRLVVDANLEASWAPVDELDGALGLDGGDGGVDVFGDDISSVQEATRHVFAVARVAFHHLVGGFEASVGDLSDGELFMVGLFGGDDRSVGGQREVDSGVRDQIGLELGQIHVQGAVEPQGSGDGGHDLADEPVQVGVGGSFNVQVPSADVVDGLIVDHEGAVGVLQGGVSREDRVVRLNDGRGDLRCRVNGKLKLGLLSVIYGQPFHEEGSETRAGASTEGVEDEEALESSTLISQLADAIQNQIDDLFADGVVTTSVVVRRILLTSDELFRVEELTVSSGADLIDDGWLQIDKDGPRNVLARPSFTEEGVEGVISTSDGFVRGHLAIGLDTMLQAVQLPTGVSDLDTGLSNMDGDTFTHFGCFVVGFSEKEKTKRTNLSFDA